MAITAILLSINKPNIEIIKYLDDSEMTSELGNHWWYNGEDSITFFASINHSRAMYDILWPGIFANWKLGFILSQSIAARLEGHNSAFVLDKYFKYPEKQRQSDTD